MNQQLVHGVIHPSNWFTHPQDIEIALDLVRRSGLEVSTAYEAYAKSGEYMSEALMSDSEQDGLIALSRGRYLLWAAACGGLQEAIKLFCAELEEYTSEIINQHGRKVPDDVPNFFEVLDVWRRKRAKKPLLRPNRRVRVTSANDDVTDAMHAQMDFDPSDFDNVPVGNFKRVIKGIGDADSQDGKAIHKRYSRAVNGHLPFTGEMPERGELKAKLGAEFPWASKVIDNIETTLDLQRSVGATVPRLKPILLVGEPGTGKTSLACRIGEALGYKTTLIPVGGTGDAAALGAVNRGWSGSRPCAPFTAMHTHEVADPCLIVDEVDKGAVVGGVNGSATGALLSMMSTPERFYDGCLLADVDISSVAWVATANDISRLPEALVDRFQVFVVPRPSAEHFSTVLASMKVRLAAEMGTVPEFLPSLDGDEYRALEAFFANKRGSLRLFDRMFRYVLGEALAREAGQQMMQ